MACSLFSSNLLSKSMPDYCYSNPEYMFKWNLCQNNFLHSKINLKMSSAKLWIFRRRLNVVRRFDRSQSVRALLHKRIGVYKSSPSTADNILMTHLGRANPAVPASYCTRPGHINPSGTYFGHTQQLNLVISQPGYDLQCWATRKGSVGYYVRCDFISWVYINDVIMGSMASRIPPLFTQPFMQK